jgi:hypothetical protein
LLARHWPELPALEATIGVLLLKVLMVLPSPVRITAAMEQARALLRRHPSVETREAIVASAASSQGVVMIEEEISIRELSGQMLEQRREIERLDKELRAMLSLDPVAMRVAALVGPTTAMVMAADLGDLTTYGSPQALEKACGLNLRETSSGKRKSGLHITKRGPSRVRQYLYLAALRQLKVNPIVRAWYASRVSRGQQKMRAIIAVVRKLVRALFFVARGNKFQAEKLFDVRRLNLEQGTKANVTPTLDEALQLDETSASELTHHEEPRPGPPMGVKRQISPLFLWMRPLDHRRRATEACLRVVIESALRLACPRCSGSTSVRPAPWAPWRVTPWLRTGRPSRRSCRATGESWRTGWA